MTLYNLFPNLNKLRYSVRTAKITPHFTIPKITWLMLFKEIIADYSENYAKPINKICGQNAEAVTMKVGGTYTYLCTLES
jgi:hypothetical protein